MMEGQFVFSRKDLVTLCKECSDHKQHPIANIFKHMFATFQVKCLRLPMCYFK